MSAEMLTLLLAALGETLLMVGVAGGAAIVLGVALGVLLVVTAPGGLLERPAFNRVLGAIVNAFRATPFIILLVALIPLTRWLVGTSIGTVAAIVPLAIAAIPFVGRITENALRDVPPGLVEAAHSMGATPGQIVRKVLLAEALPAIVGGLTITLISLVGFSAMAGAIGGGGLGDLGIRYGYQRFMPDVMALVVAVLIGLVHLIQLAGDQLARRFAHR